ncbi:MAG: hypothetical protein HY343_06690 [Lentisphaerae bacterium]|nr:hypothetical protein [Lentisphaerota bacterium]
MMDVEEGTAPAATRAQRVARKGGKMEPKEFMDQSTTDYPDDTAGKSNCLTVGTHEIKHAKLQRFKNGKIIYSKTIKNGEANAGRNDSVVNDSVALPIAFTQR